MKTLITFFLVMASVPAFAGETLDFYLDCKTKDGCREFPGSKGNVSVMPKPSLRFNEDDFSSFHLQKSQFNPTLSIQLTPRAGEALTDLTRANIQRRLILVATGRAVLDTEIRESIGDSFQITQPDIDGKKPFWELIPWIKARVKK